MKANNLSGSILIETPVTRELLNGEVHCLVEGTHGGAFVTPEAGETLTRGAGEVMQSFAQIMGFFQGFLGFQQDGAG